MSIKIMCRFISNESMVQLISDCFHNKKQQNRLFSFNVFILFCLSPSHQVSPECPDFEPVYRAIEQGLIVNFSSLKVTFDRAAALHLNQFAQGLMIG